MDGNVANIAILIAAIHEYRHQKVILYMHLMVAGERIMRTTLNIDDELLAEAQRMTGMEEKTALVREGLRALIERESARRLAKLGGSQPQLRPVRRRRAAK